MKLKLISSLAIASAALVAAPASAQVVNFAGTTEGCFGSGCTPKSTAQTLFGLTYTPGGFNHNSDSSGYLAIGGSSNNLGYFTLNGTAADYTGQLFTLLVNFTSPGNGSAGDSATLTGSVQSTTNGGVTVTFNSPLTQWVTTSTSLFSMTLPSFVGVTSDSTTSYVSAQFQAVPEPATWAMMLFGFGGIGMAMRRRRRPALAQIA